MSGAWDVDQLSVGHLPEGRQGALDVVARLAAAWFVTYLRLNAGRGMRAARAPAWCGWVFHPADEVI